MKAFYFTVLSVRIKNWNLNTLYSIQNNYFEEKKLRGNYFVL